MKFLGLVLSLFALTSVPAMAADAPSDVKFTLPALPYDYAALAPVIGEETMRTHHTKHHQAYVDKLNDEVAKTAALKGKSLEDILAHVSDYNDAVRNNAGGHWNHSFFWTLMAPEGKRGEISPELKTALERDFGSVDAFKVAFEKAGTSRFGSGWAWLVLNKQGKLEITSTANQDNPLMNDAKVKGQPILANDVWEHAYYLDYKNKRGDYLSKWWDVVNWGQVSRNYAGSIR